MRCMTGIWLLVGISVGSAAFGQKARCPKWEAGTRYPWQSNTILRGDLFAWIILKVDRSGYPIRCQVASNNYPDPESKVWLCKQYYEQWRGPRAAPSDPKFRALARFSLVPSPRHAWTDQRARVAWFRERPHERPECYPEPSRPDRMDL